MFSLRYLNKTPDLTEYDILIILKSFLYGFKVISPSVFLPAVLLISAIISLATGTSWGTLGNIGLAFMGIGA